MTTLEQKLDEVLEMVRREDPREFARLRDEAAAVGAHLAHGRAYPALVGKSHTARILASLDK